MNILGHFSNSADKALHWRDGHQAGLLHICCEQRSQKGKKAQLAARWKRHSSGNIISTWKFENKVFIHLSEQTKEASKVAIEVHIYFLVLQLLRLINWIRLVGSTAIPDACATERLQQTATAHRIRHRYILEKISIYVSSWRWKIPQYSLLSHIDLRLLWHR